MSEYLVPFEDAESEFTEKRSRFISHLWRVETEAEARARIEEMKKASEKQPENADKSSFKSMFASAYKEMTGLIEFVKSAEPEDKPVFTAKVEQLLAAVEKALKEVTAE